MISTSSLVLDGHHGHGLGPSPTAGPHHMTFVDPYLRSKLPGVPEFIRPFPKPAPIVPRFNEQRPSPSESPRKDYPGSQLSTPTSGPVNLTSVKLDGGSIPENHISTTSVNIQIPHLPAAYSSGMFPPPGFPYSGLQNPYGSLYPSSYSPLLNRPTYINSTPLSSLERQYSPPQKGNSNSNGPGVFLQPPGTYPNPNSAQVAPPPPPPPPPQTAKSSQLQFREKRPFKIPSGKETNGKQRFLSSGKSAAKRVTLPTHVNNINNSNNNINNCNNSSNSSNNNSNNTNNSNNGNINFNNNNTTTTTITTTTSNNNNNNNNNNNLLPPNFTKGSLIQLANGELRRVEDVTTEELVSSAEKCPAFRLDPSTVVRIEENSHGTVLLTLSYGENKKTIEMESTLEHPYFVYGQGWASCSPERTMSCYGLQCHRLQVGDICISLSPRQNQDFGILPAVNQ